jgi:hypothetical protein
VTGRLLVASALAIAGCHTHTRIDQTVAGETRTVPRPGVQRALAPTVEVTDSGLLRFAHPLVCTHDVMVEQSTYRVTRTRPNIATFILGLIGVSVGGIVTVIGLSDDDPGEAPATYLGAAGVLVGAPLAIGPFVGNKSVRVHAGDDELSTGTKELPCGSRPVDATAALVKTGTLQIFGGLDRGTLAVSPFTFVDAFELHSFPGLRLTAELSGDETARISATIPASELARGRDGYLRGLGVDPTVEPLRKVPGLEARAVEVSRVLAGGQPAVELRVTVGNRGPGEAYGVRAVVSSSNPQLDGRLLYVGRLAAGAEARPALVVPMRADSAALGDAAIAVRLRDAHDTAPEQPLPFRGPVLNRR